MSRFITAIVGVFVLSGTPLMGDTTWYVDDDAPGGAGTSWQDPFNDLQTALGAAFSGDEIRVAGGVYRPAAGGGPRTAGFHLTGGVAVYGGYAGYQQPNPDLRDVDLYETILSGDLGTARVYHVVRADGVAESAVLDGVTIKEGRADGTSSDGNGGGVYVSASIVTFQSCTIRDSHASNAGGGVYVSGGDVEFTDCNFHDNDCDVFPASGGGLFCGSGSITLKGCLFEGNSADFGGGMFNASGTPVLDACVFYDNEAVGSGGGMYNNGFNPTLPCATLSNCTFERNTAVGSGGGMRNWMTRPELVGCTFDTNSAGARGGAIANEEYAAPVLKDCVFDGNWSDGEGGAISNKSNVTGMLVGCEFAGNYSKTMGGGVANTVASAPTFVGCTFVGNRVDTFFAQYIVYGGGMYNDASDPTLTNCGFSSNAAVGWPGVAGAMYNYASAPAMANCTFSVNHADVLGGMFSEGASLPTLVNCVLWDVGGELSDGAGSTTTITYSIVRDGWPGVGNLDVDPMLDEMRPLPGSPCVDAGNNTAVPADVFDVDEDDDVAERVPLDADGSPRFVDDACVVDTGVADPPLYPDVVDMGAFEFRRGDIDGDGEIDLSDVAVFVDVLLEVDMSPAHISRADVNCDGFANGADIQPLVDTLLTP